MSNKRIYPLTSLFLVILAIEAAFWSAFLLILDILETDFDAFRFEESDYLWWFSVIPLIILAYGVGYWWKNRAVKRFSDSELLPNVAPRISAPRVILRYFGLRMGIGLIVIALANPQFGKGRKAGVQLGIDVVIALDVSNSMLAKDVSASRDRLAIAKMAINKLLRDDLSGDRVGLIVFAGGARKQTSLTEDFNAFSRDLDFVRTTSAAQGTNIGAAIDTALTSFNSKDKTNKAIIVVSDGESHEPHAVEAARKAYEKHKIKVYTVGLGTPTGARIPMYGPNGEQIGYKKDRNGNTVLTKLNEGMLKEIAEAGGGRYNLAKAQDLGLDEIVDEIDRIEKVEYGKKTYRDFEDQYQWFLGPGILFLILALALRSDVNTSKRRVNLFEA